MIEKHLDYLSFSALFDESQFWNEAYSPVKPVAFYKRGYEDTLGARYYFGSHKSTKAFVVLGGRALELFRDAGRQDPDTLTWALKKDGIVTRIDLAVTDFIDTDFCPVADVKAWYEGKLITSPLVERGAKFVSGYTWDLTPVVETFYVGDLKKRGQVGIFRAYDKSLDLGIGNEIITRLELEIRGDKAQSVARRLAQTNDISGNFRASFEVKSTQFERLMDAPAATVQRGLGLKKADEKEKEDKRWAWLIDVVSKSLDDAIDKDLSQGLGFERAKIFLAKSGFSQKEIIWMLDKRKKP